MFWRYFIAATTGNAGAFAESRESRVFEGDIATGCYLVVRAGVVGKGVGAGGGASGWTHRTSLCEI